MPLYSSPILPLFGSSLGKWSAISSTILPLVGSSLGKCSAISSTILPLVGSSLGKWSAISSTILPSSLLSYTNFCKLYNFEKKIQFNQHLLNDIF